MSPGRTIVLGTQIATVLSVGTPDHDVAVVDTVLPPGSGAPRHLHHDHEELFYVIEGEVEVQYDDMRAVVGPGAHLFAEKGHVHAFRNVGSTTARLLAIYGPASALDYLDALAEVLSPDGSFDPDAMRAFYARFATEAG